MAKDSDVRESTGDEYEYDLAHQETTGPEAALPAPAPQRPPPAMHVNDDSGDYGYDSAHDRS